MNQPYSFLETVFYAFLNTFPYMLLVLLTFRGSWRLGTTGTCVLTIFVTAFQVAATVLRLFSVSVQNPLFDVAFSLLYVAFIFAAIRDHIGKLAFTVLMLMNLGNLVNVLSKCIEGRLFPAYAPLRYHFTYPLMMIPVQLVLLPVIYLLIFRGLRSLQTDETPDAAPALLWRYLWLVPGVFYLIWMQHFYASGRSALENALDPVSTGYLLIIDAGSVLIYRVIIQMVRAEGKNRRLLVENHALNLQSVQYESLRRRVEEARQARHDLRHHIVLLRRIRDNRDFAALNELLAGYPDLETLDRPLLYCENETVNAILTHFGGQAAETDVRYTVKLDIPEDIFVEKADLAVLFGNLLENAVEACSHAQGERFITVSGVASRPEAVQSSLTLIVENSCGAQIRVGEGGALRSSKHGGDGIGITSVRSIAERYGGASSFAAKDGVFTASVILYHRTKQKQDCLGKMS